jgi:hypothetical protein
LPDRLTGGPRSGDHGGDEFGVVPVVGGVAKLPAGRPVVVLAVQANGDRTIELDVIAKRRTVEAGPALEPCSTECRDPAD